jgi:hypothetical protein
MKPRFSSLPRTAPIPEAAAQAWGFGPPPALPKDNPHLKRALSVAMGALSLWLLACALAPAFAALFPGPKEVLRGEVARATAPEPAPRVEPARRAELVLPLAPTPRAALVENPAPRAQPVPLALGQTGFGHLPDGRWIKVSNKGLVESFGDLPKNPALGDEYQVTEGGAREGVSWLWYTPLGWNHPAWIDP